MNATADVIILTYAEYVRLKRELKEAGLDLCYTAQVSQPVRLDWALDVFTQPEFLRQIEACRPPDASYRIAAVRLSKKGNWFRPDEFAVTFHAVGAMQDDAFQHYIATHKVHSSAEAPRAMLVVS